MAAGGSFSCASGDLLPAQCFRIVKHRAEHVSAETVIGIGEAAARLGRTTRRVRQLLEAGELEARTVAGVPVVAAESVELRRQTSVARGRPWAPSTIWAALSLLDGANPPAVPADALPRLRRRIAVRGEEELRARLSKRASVTRFSADPDTIKAIAAEPGVLIGGVIAARRAGPVRTQTGETVLYMTRERAAAVPLRFELLPVADGESLAVKAVEGLWPFHAGQKWVGACVAALDLVESNREPQASAGRVVLQRAFAAFSGAGDHRDVVPSHQDGRRSGTSRSDWMSSMSTRFPGSVRGGVGEATQ